MSSSNRFSFLDNIEDLPTLPLVVNKLSELVRNPHSSAEDITKVLETDPSLTAKILKLVNSAYYALPQRVNSVRHAVVILGFGTVKSLAISASVFDMFGGGGAASLNKEAFWQHSVGCATVSKIFAKKMPDVNDEDAFVVGLLHDIGKLIMEQYRNEDFAKAYEAAKANSSTFYEAELNNIEYTHAQVGGWLAEKWKLPKPVVQAINFHHSPPPMDAIKKLVGICHFANFVCNVKQIGSSGDFCEPVRDAEILKPLQIEKVNLSQLITSINKELQNSLALYKSSTE